MALRWEDLKRWVNQFFLFSISSFLKKNAKNSNLHQLWAAQVMGFNLSLFSFKTLIRWTDHQNNYFINLTFHYINEDKDKNWKLKCFSSDLIYSPSRNSEVCSSLLRNAIEERLGSARLSYLVFSKIQLLFKILFLDHRWSCMREVHCYKT